MIEAGSRGNKKKEEKEGVLAAKEWLKEAQNRQRGKKKERERRDMERLVKQIAIHRSSEFIFLNGEDNDLCPTYRGTPFSGPSTDPLPHPQPQHQPHTSPAPSTPPPSPHPVSASDAPDTEAPPGSQMPEESKNAKKRSGAMFLSDLAVALAPTQTRQTKKILVNVESDAEICDIFPLVEMPNPAAGKHGRQPVKTDVFRPWSQHDVRRAVDGIPHPRQNPDEFERQIVGLTRSYKLNGDEVERCLCKILGVDWHLVDGDWSPYTDDRAPLAAGCKPLKHKLTALIQRCVIQWPKIPDYTQLNDCYQEEGESKLFYRAAICV